MKNGIQMMLAGVVAALMLFLSACTHSSVVNGQQRTREHSFIFRNWRNDPHPEAGFPREYFLRSLRQSGLLKRGMTRTEAERWLGKPDQKAALTDDAARSWLGIPHGIQADDHWVYHGGHSGLHVFFQKDKVSRFVQEFEDGGPEDEVW